MNDERLKREIEEALAVDPSPQFVARVRQGLAGATLRRPVKLPWKALAAGLATAVILGGVALYQPETTPTAPAPTRNVAVVQAPEENAEVEAPPRQPATTSKIAPRQRPEPEVLINPREAEAFRSFIEDVQEQRIDPSHLEVLFEAAERSRSAEIKPMPIAGLDPIVIPPLTPAVPEKEGGSL